MKTITLQTLFLSALGLTVAATVSPSQKRARDLDSILNNLKGQSEGIISLGSDGVVRVWNQKLEVLDATPLAPEDISVWATRYPGSVPENTGLDGFKVDAEALLHPPSIEVEHIAAVFENTKKELEGVSEREILQLGKRQCGGISCLNNDICDATGCGKCVGPGGWFNGKSGKCTD